jgi:hypothetical protein
VIPFYSTKWPQLTKYGRHVHITKDRLQIVEEIYDFVIFYMASVD